MQARFLISNGKELAQYIVISRRWKTLILSLISILGLVLFILDKLVVYETFYVKGINKDIKQMTYFNQGRRGDNLNVTETLHVASSRLDSLDIYTHYLNADEFIEFGDEAKWINDLARLPFNLTTRRYILGPGIYFFTRPFQITASENVQGFEFQDTTIGYTTLLVQLRIVWADASNTEPIFIGDLSASASQVIFWLNNCSFIDATGVKQLFDLTGTTLLNKPVFLVDFLNLVQFTQDNGVDPPGCGRLQNFDTLSISRIQLFGTRGIIFDDVVSSLNINVCTFRFNVANVISVTGTTSPSVLISSINWESGFGDTCFSFAITLVDPDISVQLGSAKGNTAAFYDQTGYTNRSPEVISLGIRRVPDSKTVALLTLSAFVDTAVTVANRKYVWNLTGYAETDTERVDVLPRGVSRVLTKEDIRVKLEIICNLRTANGTADYTLFIVLAPIANQLTGSADSVTNEITWTPGAVAPVDGDLVYFESGPPALDNVIFTVINTAPLLNTFQLSDDLGGVQLLGASGPVTFRIVNIISLIYTISLTTADRQITITKAFPTQENDLWIPAITCTSVKSLRTSTANYSFIGI